VEQEQVKDPVIIESEDVTEETEPDYMQMEVKNPRIGKVLKLEEEAKRQNELEQLRSKRIRQQQEYINQMIDSVEANLKNTKEEQKLNEEFERHIRTEVYRMHGISEDKLQGMEERRNAWYQGAAFALFFLSLILVAVCGVLHGFGSELCIFMAFYTAIEGTLLSNGRKQAAFFEVLIKILYLLLYPVMLTVFVCYELKFKEYDMLVPIFVIAGVRFCGSHHRRHNGFVRRRMLVRRLRCKFRRRQVVWNCVRSVHLILSYNRSSDLPHHR
jgi:hypothetical protein